MAPYSTRQEAHDDFAMFSREGNEMVRQLIQKVADIAVAGEDPTPTKAARLLNEGREAIARRDHAEVYDTAVREVIYDRLTRLIAAKEGVSDREADQIVDRIYVKAGNQ